MCLVEHFTSIHVLEKACIRLLKEEEITFLLLGVDHHETTLPDWEVFATLIHQLTITETPDRQNCFINTLKAWISSYEAQEARGAGEARKAKQPLPAMTVRYEQMVIKPFQGLLKGESKPLVVASCLHCEATLLAVMLYLIMYPDHPLAPLLKACSHLLPVMIIS
jgi:hypothetical protein